MAIAGSGGFVPSNGVYIRNRRLRFLPITQNKPKNVLAFDMAVVADRLAENPDLSVQIPMSAENTLELVRILREKGLIDGLYFAK